MSEFVPLWPPSASAYGAEIDTLVTAFTVLIVLLSAPVFILITVFAVRYREGREADRSGQVNRRVGLEVSWALIPFAATLVFFVWATRLFVELHNPPAGALDVQVVAKQWMWKFQHPGGQREINELHVPVGQPVTLTMATQDVIHSLFIPALRIKQDVVPGRYTRLSFTVDRPGTYRLTCAEFCGTNHSEMGGAFVALDPGAYARWLELSDVDATLADEGAELFRSLGCSGCHAAASRVHAPPLEGVYGSPVPLDSGEVVIADEQYIRDSILLPRSQIAAGYPRIMPTFANILTEDQLLRLVAYVKSLATEAPPEAP